LIDWKRILVDQKFAANYLIDNNLLQSQKYSPKNCQKYRTLTMIGAHLVTRCPNSTCFKKEKNNHSWTKPKLNFEDFNLNVGEIFYLIGKCFLSKTPYLQVKEETGICDETYTRLKKRIRDILRAYYENLPKLGTNGEIIEIDEAKFIKKKQSANRKGRQVRQNDWVIGMTERNTKKSRVVIVANRNANTIKTIVNRYISKNASLVISDEWKSYRILRLQGYKTDQIKHKKEFVKKELKTIKIGENLLKIKIHTNTIESLWSRLKRISKIFWGISRTHFQGVIDEILFISHAKCLSQNSIILWIKILKQVNLFNSTPHQIKWHVDQRLKKKFPLKKVNNLTKLNNANEINGCKIPEVYINQNPKKRKMPFDDEPLLEKSLPLKKTKFKDFPKKQNNDSKGAKKEDSKMNNKSNNKTTKFNDISEINEESWSDVESTNSKLNENIGFLQPLGLPNRGNLCYLNAILQMTSRIGFSINYNILMKIITTSIMKNLFFSNVIEKLLNY